MNKLIRITTVPISLDILLKGQLKFLSGHYQVIAVSGEGEHLEIVRAREGVNTIGVEMERTISPLKDLQSLWKLYRCFRKEKPIIVHSITPKAGLLSMLAAKIAGVPIRMHTFTGLIFPTRKGFMQKLLIKMDQLLCWAATNVYPEGDGVKNDLLEYKITQKPLNVLANGNVNGIDTAYFSDVHYSDEEKLRLLEELGVGSYNFVFVFVGRLVKDKGINELIAAFARLSNDSCWLLLVGPFESELDPLLPETLYEIENNTNIISVGYQNDVRPYLAVSDCLTFPSYREGFPNVVMQAGAMGLPSIVTDINGCNEIIVDGENGVIVAPKDENAFFEAMAYFVEHPAEVESMATNARPLIVSRYEQKVVWNALLEEYKRLEKEKPNK